MNLPRISLIAVTAFALGLSSCAGTPPQPESTNAAVDPSQFPVTIQLPGDDQTLTLEQEPKRIVVLSADAAIALHELGLTDRIVAVPEMALSPTINSYAGELGGVAHRIAGETAPEPEQVLAWNPDLVIVTTRHTGEKDASARLTDTGVPVLSLTNGWSSSEAIIENISLIGQATGNTEKAAQLADEIRDGLTSVRDRSSSAVHTPSVAVLSNQAHAPFMNGNDSLVTELVENAGGSNAAAKIGVDQTMPVQPELLLAAQPDYLMLIDVSGRGEAAFAELLANPAVAALPAVAEGRVKMFPAHQVYGLAGTAVVSGSQAVLNWLHPELAS